MATVTFFQPTDFLLPEIFGEISIAGPAQIQLKSEDGFDEWNFLGSFLYGTGGLSGGTVTSANYFLGSVKEWQVTGMSMSAVSFFDYLANLNTSGLLAAVFAGADTFIGSSGDDGFNGFAGNDTMFGNGGNDALLGGAGDDKLYGGEGNDFLVGGAGSDTISGGNGIDTASYVVTTAAVTVSLAITTAQNTLGAGIDTLTSIENLIGGAGADKLTGNSGANLLRGGAGNDTLLGGDGNDMLIGVTGNDILNGGNGTDTASYLGNTSAVAVNLGLTSAQNTIGAGIDTLTFIENLIGGNSGDTLTGNGGSNSLDGYWGNDILNGQAGSDILDGNFGNDILAGGAGADFFVFSTAFDATLNKDTITDFNAAEDTMRLENTGFGLFNQLSLGTLNAAFFKANATGTATDANDHIIYNTVTGALFYDANGNAAGGVAQFATLTAHPTITAADFFVI
jgi:serralysin